MRLLIISGHLAIGGAERFVSNLLMKIDRNTIEASLCLLENRIDYDLPDDLPISILPTGSSLNYLKKVHFIRETIKKDKPDIILSNIALINRLTGMALMGMAKRPHWVARIGNNPTKGGRSYLRNIINVIWDGFAYRQVDRFVVNSAGLKEALEKTHKHSINKISILYNPIDFSIIEKKSCEPPLLSKPENKFLIISVGRFHRQKRYDLLIRSFADICRVLPTELWICGDGYLRKSIEEDISACDATNHVKLLGHCANPFPLMKLADLFLMTSDWEGMPNALIEAMGLGVPAVATRCPFGPEEIIEHEVTGMLAAPGDQESIKNMALDLLENPQKRLLLSTQGLEKVHEMFDSDRLIRKWTEFLLYASKKH